MRLFITTTLAALALGAGACSSKPACEKLAERLCEGANDKCLEAKAWVDAQGPSEDMCKRLIDDPTAVAAYRDQFLGARVAEPTPVTPGASPAPKATTKDKVRNVGETIEEIGNTGEKTGEAIDKVQDAIDRARK